MKEKPTPEEMEQIMESVYKSVDYLGSLGDAVNQRLLTRGALQKFLGIKKGEDGGPEFDDTNRSKNHIDFVAPELVLAIRKKHKSNHVAFIHEIKENLAEIMKYDHERRLTNLINKTELKTPKEEGEFLMLLNKKINAENPNDIATDMKLYSNSYINKISALGDKKLAAKLHYHFNIISGTEEKFLGEEIEAIKKDSEGKIILNMPEYIVHLKEDLKVKNNSEDKVLVKWLEKFNRKSNISAKKTEAMFLKNTIKEIEEKWSVSSGSHEPFREIVARLGAILRYTRMKFNDEHVIREVKKTDVTRRLLYYNKLVEFFGPNPYWDLKHHRQNGMLMKINMTLGAQRAEWTEFLKDVVDKAEQNAETVRKMFAEHFAADYILKTKREQLDNAYDEEKKTGWMPEIKRLMKGYLMNPNHTQKVLDEAKPTLINIFDSAEKRLHAELKDSVEKLISILVTRRKYLEKKTLESIKDTRKILSKKLHELQRVPEKMAGKIVSIANEYRNKALEKFDNQMMDYGTELSKLPEKEKKFMYEVALKTSLNPILQKNAKDMVKQFEEIIKIKESLQEAAKKENDDGFMDMLGVNELRLKGIDRDGVVMDLKNSVKEIWDKIIEDYSKINETYVMGNKIIKTEDELINMIYKLISANFINAEEWRRFMEEETKEKPEHEEVMAHA